MSCIHYKFRSALEYDTITFDGLSISLADLKHSIITQKKFAKNTDFDLEVTNAQTKEEYKDDMTMIPKNSSVVVRRIPTGTKSKAQLAVERSSPFSSGEQKTSAFQEYQVPKTNRLSKVADLANADASEEDKLKAMMKQSGEDWDPSQYVRGRRPYAPGVPVPQNYVCYRCGKPGHFIRNCPTNGDTRFDVPKAKRTTGIPRTFLGTTEGTASPPNRVSPSLPDGDSKTKGKEKDSTNKKVPSELKCPMCNNLLTDAVLIPCCGTSYCDDCIRNYLLENEQECSSCGAENVSPDSLVINKQLRQAVNTFKNARPASPYIAPVVKSAAVANKSTDVKSQLATKDVANSASDKPAPESKPAVENKVVKEVNDTEGKTKENSPKLPQVVNPPEGEPQPIRVHHRDAISQQGPGLKPGGAPFDPRRRQDFHPRGAQRVPEIRHGLPEPIIPRGLPPDHVPRVPAVRPNIPGPSHPRPQMNVPGYMPRMPVAISAAPAPIPRIPTVPAMVRPALPHHPAFGAPVFDPLHAVDVPRSLTPPMSEREFYKMQKKLKTRNKKKREHEHPSASYSSHESRSRKEPRKDSKKDPGKESGLFDFDDELSEYRKLQKSRQRLRSRSLTPSRSWSRSPSRSRSRSFSRSRSRSRTHSSRSPSRSPTPEGWDQSRSPSPTSSRGKIETGPAEEKKRKHKKRKKEQKGKERKKQKTSHGKESEASAEQKEGARVDENVAKTSEKKKHKRLEKDKASNKETAGVKDKGTDVGKEKNAKETKEKGKEKEKGKKKKEKKKGSDKEKGKEKEEKKIKEKKKKKDKSKKDETSSGKKRKNKKKHKKHKRHKKEKSKDEKGADEEETSDTKVTKSEDPGVSPGDEENSTEDEKDENETRDSDEGETIGDSEEEEEDEEENERMSKEETKGDIDDDKRTGKEDRQRSEEREEWKMSGEEEEVGEQERHETEKLNGGKEMEGDKREKEVTTGLEGEEPGRKGSDEKAEVNEDDVDEEKRLGDGSDDDLGVETKLIGNGSVKNKEADVEKDHTKLGERGGYLEIELGIKEDKGFAGRDENRFGIQSGKRIKGNDEVTGK